MEWFEEMLVFQREEGARPGGVLRALARRCPCMLFQRIDSAFRLVERHGYRDPEFSYAFLEERPGLLAEAFRRGHARLPDAGAHQAGRVVWAVVDRPRQPDSMLLVELPADEIEAGGVLRQALNFELALRQSAPAAPDTGAIDLPVWLSELLPVAAERDSPLLIQAEPGSGKEEFVLALIRSRFGANEAGVFFHPGRLSQAVQLRELFGDPAGARLGGAASAVPILRRENRVVVIQETGDLAPHAQLRILALFSEAAAEKFWIFETSRDLERMSRAEKFLPGLFRRLEAGRLELPPVRAVKGRIEEEAGRLLASFRARYRREMELESGALDAMLRHDWRGNWRELRNTLESAFLMSVSGRIRAEDLRLGLWTAPEDWDDLNLRKRSEEMEKGLLLRAYSLHGGNQVQMARALGISRGSLQYKLEKYGMN